MHLAADAQAHNLMRVSTALFQDRADRVLCRTPPVVRILFRPAVLRLMKRVFFTGGSQCGTGFVKQDRLGPGSPQIYTQQHFHDGPSSMFHGRVIP